MKKHSKILIAGVACMVFAGTVPTYASISSTVTTVTNITPIATAPQSAYENIAVSQVTGYVNVRTEPNTSSSVVGKIYNSCAATIEETVEGEGGSWYKIRSGTVSGYIKAQYFVTGDQAETMARQIGKEFATVNTDSLRLRETPDLNGNVMTVLSRGSEYVVLAEEGDFYRIAIDNDMEGYVAKEYVTTDVRFDQALSLQEEAAKKQDELQRKQDADTAIAALEEVRRVEPNPDGTTTETVAAPTTGTNICENDYSDSGLGSSGSTTTQIGPGATGSLASTSGTSAVTSATRTAIVAYAKQFLGNPYVYGGTSLTSGTDCSGFTQGIFANFDIAIGRSSRDQAYQGRTISIDQIQPGDLVFYASGDYINHAALYIGGGQIIHASNPNTGIVIAAYNYRTPYKAVTFLD